MITFSKTGLSGGLGRNSFVCLFVLKKNYFLGLSAISEVLGTLGFVLEMKYSSIIELHAQLCCSNHWGENGESLDETGCCGFS